MGFVFLVLLVVILLNIIMPPPGGAIGFTGKEEKTRCPLHKWEYTNNRLICEYCKKTPEEVCAKVL